MSSSTAQAAAPPTRHHVAGRYDSQARRTAALIQRAHPAWLVMYGPWSRRYWAYGTLTAADGSAVVLSAPGDGDLTAQIRQAEAGAPHNPSRKNPR